MIDIQQPTTPANLLEEPRKLPGMLNVLTVLTFIWCGISAISAAWSFVRAKSSYDQIVEMQSKVDEMPAFMQKMMGPAMVEMARHSYENRVPILLLSLVGVGLCLYGALQMRQFKKVGFYVYFIGEIMPIVIAFLFIGMGAFGGFAIFGTLLFPVLFLILYATQLKYLS